MRKKNIIIKMFTVFLLVLYFYFNKEIYAVDLKFRANVTKGPTVSEILSNPETAKTKQTEQVAVLRTFSKRISGANPRLNWEWWIRDNRGGTNYYTTYGISFWGNKLSAVYDTTVSSREYKASYDTTSDFVKTESEDPSKDLPTYSLIKNSNGTVKYVSVLKANTSPDLSFDLNLAVGTKYYRKRTKDIYRNGYYTTVHDTVITKSGVDEIINKYYKNGDQTYVEDGYLKIRFSIMTHTLKPQYINEEYPGLGGFMPTARHAVAAAKWMVAHNLALDGTSGTSILNYYDNWLYIPIAKLNGRTVEIRYRVKDANGNWTTVKTENKQIGSEAVNIAKVSIGDNDKYYIGGKIAKGSTKAQANTNLASSTNSWGWNTSNTNIGASNNEEHYVIEFYYDHRDISVSHLKTDGSVINSDLNKRYTNLLTSDSITFKAIIPLYNNYEKYVHVSTNVDGTTSTLTTVKINALDGANKLVMGDKHTVKFFYEFEPTRQVYVRHFVYNDDTGTYERQDVLTNLNAAVKDGEENKYYLRKNGYNQRHYKAGELNYTDTIKSGFNEQYTIDFSDTIKLDKSRTIENEGSKYVYKGVKIQNDSAPAMLTTKAQADTLNTTTNVELGPEKVTKTYVDFYYTKTDINPPGGGGGTPDNPDDPDNPSEADDSPTIDFIPKNDDGVEIGPDSGTETGDCKTVYVPSGENLKAYITATSYRPYSLIYDGASVNETTGEITYKLRKYDAYKFVNGYVQNTADSKYGYFNSTEKNGVFNTNSDTFVNPIAGSINNILVNSVSEFQSLNPNTLTVVNDGRKTVESDFGNDNVHKINYDKYNGIRIPTGKASYNVVSLVSEGNVVFNEKIGATAVNTKNNTQVNVYTPAAVKDLIIESEEVVNHSNQDTFVIQKNSEFKVTPVTGEATDYKNINDTAKYIKYYWFVADFDVKLLENQIVFDKNTNSTSTVSSGQIVRAGNLIQIPKGGSFRAIATNDDTSGDIINQFSNKLKVVAVTYNVTDESFENKILTTIKAESSSSYVDKNKIAKVTSSCGVESNKQNHKNITDVGGIYVTQMYDDAHYFVENTKTSKNIGRVYDFKVTDCLDVNFKNVFRKSDNGNVNDLRGIQYFSGIRRLLVYGGSGVQIGGNQSNQNNIFDDRAADTINSVVTKTILPLGPYKHIDTNYLQAPKLGYRISFDLKTSGTYVKSSNDSSVRYIKITPSYYYISKDGKTFKENIALYYKNSSGRYVNFEGSGYTIYFKPNDGYRTTYNTEAPELKDMSTKLEALKIGGTSTDKSFKLTDSMMSYSDNNFVQAWYGEFKLPNSTIAVEVGADGRKDINKPLTDGYIGVRFDIQCIDKETSSTSESEATIVSYNQNDKSAASSTNTTQWDYEGYLGFATSNIGSGLRGELRIQLEKDFWKINTQEMYEKIKGTVVLYDTDNRAANDFD